MATELSVSRIVADFTILILCAIPLLIFHEWVTPYKRGFYCDDESIRYPYRASTVSRQMLIFVGLIVPTVLIVCTELFRTVAWERKCEHEFKEYECKRHSVPRFVVRLYVFLGYFFVGVVFNQLMVDIAKYTIGRHRPHFMEVCKPKHMELTQVKSDAGSKDLGLGLTRGFETCPVNSHEYITNFECTGTDKFLVQESMLSFYSGHAAFSFYAAWFTALYLQARLYRPLYSRLLLPVIQFALFSGATFVAYTRVSNYKHHWSDVLVGAVVGSVIGIFVALVVAEVFDRREIPSCDDPFNHSEFGLVRRAPKADVENGLRNSGGGGDGGQVASHTVIVTRDLAPNKVDFDNQPFRNQRFPTTSLQSVSMTGSYYSALTERQSLLSTPSTDFYSVSSRPAPSANLVASRSVSL